MRTKPKKVERNTIAFGGLNVTSGAREGELKDCKNVSAEFFPNLATRRGRTRVNSFSSPTALHSFNGFIVVDGTDLIYKGQVVGSVSPGIKQFAVVSNKLVIHPDMLMLDLVNNKLSRLFASVISESASSTFGKTGDNDYLEVTSSLSGGTGQKIFTYTEAAIPVVKKYSALSWSEIGGWVKTGEAEVAVNTLVEGDLLIPTKVLESGSFVIPTKTTTGYTGEDNSEGVYYEVSSSVVTAANQHKWAKYNLVESYNEYTYYNQGSWVDGGLQAYGQGSGGYTCSDYSFNPSTGTFTTYG
jgi:hypothetical protein